MPGTIVSVLPIDADRHAENLFAANSRDRQGKMWTYMGYGPFATLAHYQAWIEKACLGEDPMFHAIVENATGKACGVASYLRIEPGFGVIEVGHIALSPELQRRTGATEAMYLMMKRVFDELGYRRYEWKCDALNEPSRVAAGRLGFTFEGVFRQHMLYKGRNRDTAWYSVTDKEWPRLKRAFETWLASDNFDSHGRQKRHLADFRTED